MTKLISKIKNNTVSVGVIGLGYVGLELMLNIRESKYKVFGFDINKLKIEKLKKNIPTINTISKKRLSILNKENLFDTSNISKIDECDIIIICVPTPLKKKNIPDMSYIENTLNLILKYLKPEQLIILESTVYPGATKEIFYKKINHKKELNIGKNFYLGFSPERISPGKDYRIKYKDITKVISGYSNECLKAVEAFYKKIFKHIHKAESLEVAEFSKLFENCFRAVNIGLANQMKMISSKLGLKITDIIEAAKTKHFGFKAFGPGPGVGGHCIPIDPVFISWVARKNGEKSDFIDISRDVNLNVTNWVVKKIVKSLKFKAKILILGVAYKKDIDDCRESPAVNIIKSLQKKNFSVDYFDPYIQSILINRKQQTSLKKIDYKKLKLFDAVVVVTDHSKLNYKLILKNSKKIFDTRGVYKKSKNQNIIHC